MATKKRNRVRRECLTPDEKVAYDLISKDPKYASAAKVLAGGLTWWDDLWNKAGKLVEPVLDLLYEARR